MPLLQNHIAVVTGAGSGIGRAIAAGYAREGARVVLLDMNEKAAAEAAQGNPRCRRQGRELRARRDQTRGLHRDGQADRRQNRAGLDPRQQCRHRAPQRHARRDEAVIKDWEDIIAINLTGVFNVTHAFLAPLRASKGRIVNIGSIQSFVHLRTPSSPAYTASKHGVLGFTKALAAELGKEGVRVNAIGPGFIETPLNAHVRASNPELAKTFIAHTPLGRAGTPEDIVGPAIFLASDLSAYVTGSIVMVDGGYRTV